MFTRADSNKQRLKRHKRIRAKISGTADRPRLSVYRSEQNIYVQVIDDTVGRTLVSASSVEKEFGKECRGIVLGYMQRGGGPTVYDRLLSLRMASCAVHCAVKRMKTSAICIDKGEVFPMPISKAIKAPLRVHKKHLALFDELHK